LPEPFLNATEPHFLPLAGARLKNRAAGAFCLRPLSCCISFGNGPFGSAAAKLECEIIEMDGERDHVHLLIAYPPKLAVSMMVNNLKSGSSRLLRQQNSHLRMQSKTGLLWSRSYFACSAGGATIETLKAYVLSQNTPE